MARASGGTFLVVRQSIPSLTPGMELTAYSLRSCVAPAFGSSSYLALI
jgi:hypothetical protein